MWLRTIGLIIALALGMLAVPLQAEAQPQNVPRICFLGASAPPESYVTALRQGLEERGYVEGKTILIEYRHAANQPDQLPALAAEQIGVTISPSVLLQADKVIQ